MYERFYTLIYNSCSLVYSERCCHDNIIWNDITEHRQQKTNQRFLSVLLQRLEGEHILF